MYYCGINRAFDNGTRCGKDWAFFGDVSFRAYGVAPCDMVLAVNGLLMVVS